jgi:hypothetical protein
MGTTSGHEGECTNSGDKESGGLHDEITQIKESGCLREVVVVVWKEKINSGELQGSFSNVAEQAIYSWRVDDPARYDACF